MNFETKEPSLRKTIRELREESGLTQFELATKIEVTPSAVHNWEVGRNEPKASQLRKIAMLFAVTMDSIAFEPEEVKSVG